jgi:hypothetical protein
MRWRSHRVCLPVVGGVYGDVLDPLETFVRSELILLLKTQHQIKKSCIHSH